MLLIFNSNIQHLLLLISVLNCILLFPKVSSAQIAPHLSSIMINSCNGTCSEGDNEIVFGNTGNNSVLATPANLELTYGSTANPTTTYTDTYINSAAKTTALNTASGCGTPLLIDAANTTIPPNSTFIITRSTICASALNWSGLCGQGPIYIIYSTDATWTTGGNFVNTTGTTRYFRTRITNTLGVQTTFQYSYSLPAIFNNDGAYITFDNDGGPAIVYGDNDCNLAPTMLPSELVFFELSKKENNSVLINWTTASENNTERFDVFHSIDGYTYNSIGSLSASGNSQTALSYSFEHSHPKVGMNYYQLIVRDHNADIKLLDQGAVNVEQTEISYNSTTSELLFGQIGNYEIYSIDGKKVLSIENTNRIFLDLKGMYIVRDVKNETSKRIFLHL